MAYSSHTEEKQAMQNQHGYSQSMHEKNLLGVQ